MTARSYQRGLFGNKLQMIQYIIQTFTFTKMFCNFIRKYIQFNEQQGYLYDFYCWTNSFYRIWNETFKLNTREIVFFFCWQRKLEKYVSQSRTGLVELWAWSEGDDSLIFKLGHIIALYLLHAKSLSFQTIIDSVSW